MKIALLSFHNTANYGAALQAYALERYLHDKGYRCEYINYVNPMRGSVYSMTSQILESLKQGNVKEAILYLVGSPMMMLRKRKFRLFYDKNLVQTKQIYKSSGEAVALNKEYDAFIVGSDQVWNPHNNGRDTAFLLDFVEDGKKKISYASSFGVSSLDDEIRGGYAQCLNRIDRLSVREQFGQRLVEELTGRKAEVVLDPVFLLRKEDWMQFIPLKKPSAKYVFSYTNRANQFASFIQTTKYSLNGIIHYKLGRNTSIQDFISRKVRVKYSMSPAQFVGTIYHAELVVSASFHCIALAILLNKPFVAILTNNKGKDERILNLLRQLGLESRILTSEMTSQAVNAPIDYDAVNKTLAVMRESSTHFLIEAIES